MKPGLRICSLLFLPALSLLPAACSKHISTNQLAPKTYGTQMIEVSGSKQVAEVGGQLPQPVVLQVNGADGNAVEGALVTFRGDGLSFNPQQALSDSSGQVTTAVRPATTRF